MKKKISIFIVVLMALGAGCFYYAYLEAANDYPVKILENIIKERLASSQSYKRISARTVSSKDGASVELKFSAKNRMGVDLDSAAYMSLVSDSKYELENTKDIGPHHREYLEENSKKPFVMGERFAIDGIALFNRDLPKEEVQRINTDMIMNRGSYPFSPPSLKASIINRYN